MRIAWVPILDLINHGPGLPLTGLMHANGPKESVALPVHGKPDRLKIEGTGERKARSLNSGMAALLAVRTFRETALARSNSRAIEMAAAIIDPHTPNGPDIIRQKLKRKAVKAEADRLAYGLWGKNDEGVFCLGLRYFDLERRGLETRGWVNGWLWDSSRADAVETNGVLSIVRMGRYRRMEIDFGCGYHTFLRMTRER